MSDRKLLFVLSRPQDYFRSRWWTACRVADWEAKHALLALSDEDHGNHVVARQQRRLLMLKTLALSASVLAFARGLAFAEATLPTGQWLASEIYKASVYDPSEQKIGGVTDLIIDGNGNVTAAIISVSSGFLGVNQKDVVIPFKELKVSTRDGKDWLILNRTKDELMTAPAYNNTGAPSDYRNR
jgi:sporulation protein YlmC with PRC-barrel domain